MEEKGIRRTTQKVLSGTLVPLHHIRENMGQAHEQTGRKALQGSQCVLEEERLLVHLLESSAFASEFKNAVIVKTRPAASVLF